jgi:putative tryptophan/tyrosine transport system substrate-binding protein
MPWRRSPSGARACHQPARRRFLIAMSGALLAPAAAFAEVGAQARRIGILSSTPIDHPESAFREFYRALGEQGFAEPGSLDVVRRHSGGADRRFAELAAELAGLKLHAIVAIGSAAAVAAKKATATIPIVMVDVSSPERLGLIATLARPGGNVTGLTNMLGDIGPKYLELIKQALPDRTRVATLWNPDNPASAASVRGSPQVYKAVGLEIIAIPVRAASELPTAFQRAARERAQVVSVHAALSPHKRRILALAVRHGLPVVSPYADWARSGALLSFGPDHREAARLAAGYVARILKGANPAEMPVQQPTKFVLLVNLKTAKTLNIEIPDAITVRADEVIE